MSNKTKSRKFLVGRMQRSNHGEITQEMISQAVQSFKAKGGYIEQLPPQHGEFRQHIGRQHGSPFERVLET